VQIGGVHRGADGIGRQVRGDLVQPSAITCDQADMHALARELGGDRGADAAVATGDQRGLAAEPEFRFCRPRFDDAG
jgi:hypothetical protein